MGTKLGRSEILQRTMSKKQKEGTTLRLILGDQLNREHPWFNEVDDNVSFVMAEVRQETDYVNHHIQKVVGIFMAMRKFAGQLKKAGHQLHYFTLDETQPIGGFEEVLANVQEETGASHFEFMEPDEYRLDQQLRGIAASFESWECVSSHHFLTERDELATFFKGKKTYLMESFYRSMRKKYNILMEDDQPTTGKWNYDASNRKKLPANRRPTEPMLFQHDVSALVELLEKCEVKTIGELDPKNFIWPVTRKEALELFDYFLEEGLHLFGDFQDAMAMEYWSIYHSRISFAMNIKLVSPLEIVKAVEEKWERNQDSISISQAEGYIRQVLGWREYMRGVYWAKMPDYANLNYFNHERALPTWFWTGETKMNCLKQSIKQSLQFAYAHHIQRLMVTGNFALLAGIHPDEVDAWYLGIYIDAFEWVEITNTRGMSQFADGGIVGTKPYVSSANYMHKQGDYCSGCSYKKEKKVGEGACPFNSLYWHFYARNEELLAKNPRIGMAYRTLAKMAPEKKNELLDQAEEYLENIEQL